MKSGRDAKFEEDVVSDATYRALRKHLDSLPGGYPATGDGLEMRILRRLFTPEEAVVACHLTLIPETARVIARRVGSTTAELDPVLATMAQKGLIYSIHHPGNSPTYQAAQFVVGIYEYQLGKMDVDLIRDLEAYWPTLFRPEIWKNAPQLRTIPVHESVTYVPEVMAYEQVETLIRAHDRIAVAPCICRQEKALLGEACDKPSETCLSFDGGADFYVRNGMGRYIDIEEALGVIALANETGLVLQPSNSKKATFICACCGCCCGILTNLKRYPEPANLVSTPFRAHLDPNLCIGCGICVDRCQMDALTLEDSGAALDLARCIGCGLCVSTCPTGALILERKPRAEQRDVPVDIARTMIRLAHARGRLGPLEMVRLATQSAVDRLLARK
ncbi:MAG: 4Fe-4S binding protein [Anaerolineae bacterium]|jgi:formate hydrogenlyase subunit 6/NADH:ubiquinone oxidoreductase subunit I|nr:4Fe-4S binding protein [Anaerolineae bacterium]